MACIAPRTTSPTPQNPSRAPPPSGRRCARFISGEHRLGRFMARRPLDIGALRIPPLWREAGLGLPVRRRDAGAADRHAPVLSARRAGCRATTSWWSHASPSRACCSHAHGDARRSEGHPDLPPGRHRHGGVQDPSGSWIYPEANLLRIGGVPLFSGFMYAAFGSYIAPRLAALRLPLHPLSAGLGGAALARRSTSTSSAHHLPADVRWVLFAAAGVMFGRCRIHFRPGDGTADAAAGRLPPGRAVHLVRRESRHLRRRLDVSAPAAAAGRWCRRPSSAPGSC